MTSKPAVSSTKIAVIVRKKDGILFQGDATSISSIDANGVFDVLPEHTNFVAVIQSSVTVRPVGQPDITYSIPRGILHVKTNAVEIFVGI